MDHERGTHDVPALIFGGHITALGVLRTLVRRGVPCYVVDDTSDIIVRSRWYRRPARMLPESADSAALAAYLEALPFERAVLIPCSDLWMQAVSSLPAELRDRFPASIPTQAAVQRFVDKAQFLALVDDLAIPHPRTYRLSGPQDIDTVPDDALVGGFLKPAESHRFYQRFGTKGSFVASRAQARDLIATAAADDIELMLQEWVPGPVSNTILLDGFVDRAGDVTTIVARRRLRMDPPRLANTACDMTIPIGDVQQAVDDTKRLLRAVAYRGIFNVEYKLDVRDDRWKIIEVNARPFWLIAHIARTGADLPWLAYRDALELPLGPAVSYEVGRYGMYEVPEIAAITRAWLHLRRPDGPVIGPWMRGDHTLIYWSDPLPGAFDLARAARRRFGASARAFVHAGGRMLSQVRAWRSPAT